MQFKTSTDKIVNITQFKTKVVNGEVIYTDLDGNILKDECGIVLTKISTIPSSIQVFSDKHTVVVETAKKIAEISKKHARTVEQVALKKQRTKQELKNKL